MSVNGITGATSAYAATNVPTSTKAAEAAAEKKTAEDKGVVYEPSTNAKDSNSTKVTDYSSIVSKLKQQQASHTQQLQNLVDKLLIQLPQHRLRKTSLTMATGAWNRPVTAL